MENLERCLAKIVCQTSDASSVPLDDALNRRDGCCNCNRMVCIGGKMNKAKLMHRLDKGNITEKIILRFHSSKL